ncbi:uncharacterized protein A1O9_06843 [Exophiala aquamarina CBS 119918]|uniref:SET domain-containing protein n=1 Tax=Exophiala aquamarina CBS 119918 TaxID=1182545 RepID=A0A072P950_9EURO|nr:uncharacterized protein A1O9_06843 [Exophiala aquamarina CBS 119918]KEF56654.1 hypothetical protein A1O9_06843 [Exophiala aquamarina CBS 119918]
MHVPSALATLAVLVRRGYSPASIFVSAHEDGFASVDVQELFQQGEAILYSGENNGSTSTPWSYEPACTQVLDNLGSTLCVYTSKTFGNNRGISLFTTPTIAEKIAISAPFHTSDALSDNAINTYESRWYTSPTPGRGLGLFAKAPVRRGETITANTPVLVAYTEGFLPKAEREKFLRIAVDQLPAPTRASLLELSNLYRDPDMLLQGVVSGNAFDLQISGRGHLAIFPEAARINHACSPNSLFRTNSSLLSHQVLALRSIDKDEEITIAYSNPLETYAERQNHLRDSFHFTCTCSRCSRGEIADGPLKEIADLQAALSDWTPTSEANVKKAERLIKIYQDEGLDGYIDPAYCHAALTYNSVGGLRGAQKYIKLALEANKLRLGPTASDLGACNGMAENPQGHWSWRMRKPI